MEKVTMVIAPYGTEKVLTALRIAEALLSVDTGVRIFLHADSVTAAKKRQ
jgi:sulfur relay (sulfurtransferase) complex TusBCD TusD component (DsrE family)